MELFEALLREHKKELKGGNSIIAELPDKVNEFLMDLSQTYDDDIYSAVLNKNDYTENEIKSLDIAATAYFEAAEEMATDYDEFEDYVTNNIIGVVYDVLGMVK